MLRRIRHMLDAVIARTRFERDLRDELRIHAEQRAQDLINAGISAPEAMRQARMELGAVETYKEQCRDARGFAAFRPFHGLGGDVRLAARRLLATPQFLVFAVMSLAIGIAVTTAVYSVVNSLLWGPIGVAQPDRTIFVAPPGPGTGPMRTWMSKPDFDDLIAAQKGFRSLGASRVVFKTLVGSSHSELVAVEAVSGEYFATVGVLAAIGRTIQPQDDASRAAVMVLSDRVWRGRFEADPKVVGRVVKFGGQAFEVIGVARAEFNGLDHMMHRARAWIPLSATALFESARGPSIDPREVSELTVIGLLRPGATVSSAAAELAIIAGRLDAEFPRHGGSKYNPPMQRRWSARLIDSMDGRVESRFGSLIVALIGLVLVVACMNLANLMLARGTTRQREFAVRRALGASRWRIVRELCAESALVAVLGGVAAYVLTRVLLTLATVDLPLPSGSFSLEPRLDVSALVVASAALLLSMLVFGVEPALQLTRRAVTTDFAGGVGTIEVPRSGRQRAFIRWQVAISATFFLVAAILVKVVVAEARHDSGVDVDRLAAAVIPLSRDWDAARSQRALLAVADVLRQEGTVGSVTVSSGAPFGMTATPHANLTTPDRPFRPAQNGTFAFFLSATPDIFGTLGVPILRGRGFDQRDGAAAPHVVVLSQKTARDLFGTSDAIGRQVLARDWGRPPDLAFTVIGIASDTDSQNLMSRKTGTMYVPLAQHYEPRIAMILARTSGDPAAMARLIQTAVRRVEPDLGIATAGPASIVLAGAYFAARVAVWLATALGMLTLVLAMVGLYGIQAHVVAQRTREVGVRLALGASIAQIERMVMREGYRPVVQGLLLGLFFGVAVRFILRAYMNANIQPFDPVAFALVPIPLVIAAFLACYVPARRAARVDPNVALRHL